MNCKGFQRWLDTDRSGASVGSAPDHARSCPACRRELERSVALDALLVDVSAPTAPGFVSSVMARVARTPQQRVAPTLLPTRERLPWWVQAAAHPTVVLAFVIISLLLWQGETLIAATTGLITWLNLQSVAAGSYLGSLADPAHRAYLWIGLILGFSPLLFFLYLALYKGSLTLMLRLSGAIPSLARQ